MRSINSITPDRDGDINLASADVTESVNLYFTNARADARIALATVDNLADTPAGIGTAGQVLAVNSGRTGYEFANQPTIPDLTDYVRFVNDEAPDDGNVVLTTELVPENTNLYYTDARFDTRYATKTHYHDRYATEAETARSGATANVELYYTARPDGDGIAESATSDTGVTDTINRTLYYATKFDADPDTALDWTEYTTQPVDNATFATAKAALLAGLNDTDATAETRGTLPLSLKMVRTTTAVGGDLLLDTYTGAAAAYSVRKLDKDYTGYCMKVRRASDDAEADIGFDGNGDLDTAAIATHCGSANGYVVTWYDQSGNANNATQSTSGNQPQIYNGTAVITENGKPALNTSSTSFLTLGSTLSLTDMCILTYANRGTPNDNGMFIGDNTTTNNFVWDRLVLSVTLRANGTNSTITGSTATGKKLYLLNRSSNACTLRINLSQTGTATNSGTLSVGSLMSAYSGNSFRMVGDFHEMIVWNSNQSTNLTGIETDLDNYYTIS